MTEVLRRSSAIVCEPKLFIAASADEAWRGTIWPWFDAVLPQAWREPLPSVVVVPTLAHAQALKQRLAEERRSHLGIQFATPSALRQLVAVEPGATLREDLELLLAIAAHEVATREGADDVELLAAKSVIRAPSHLLRTLERCTHAGWLFERLEVHAFEPIVRRFCDHLKRSGLSLVAEAERRALDHARENPPRFASVLISGFDAAHWPLWFLLRAAIENAQDATVVLSDPRDFSGLETSWIGSWEELFGEAKRVSSASRFADGSLFSEAEMRGEAAVARCTFLVGADIGEEAEAIALACLRFLAQDNCTRVGVVFGRGGALSRLVAAALAHLEIPHNDGFAHPAPGLFESAEWRAWIELQRAPRVRSFVDFIKSLENRGEVFAELSLNTIEETLREVHAHILIDDLNVLAEACAASPGERKGAVAAILRRFIFLPSAATAATFLEQTFAAFRQFGWKQHEIEIVNRVDDWPNRFPVQFPRALYLRWLEQAATSFAADRSPLGNNPYARVQLLTVRQALDQEWSHLIFAGWNEGTWPPPANGGFAREDEIAAFNESVRQLNRRASARGSQGEGHTVVREGHTFYLGPAEQRAIALRQFDELVESASIEIAFTASFVEESAPERPWNPNELFTRFYQQIRNAPLTQHVMVALQRATREWIGSCGAAREPSASELKQTRCAFDARRDPAQPSAEYDFAFRTAPPRVPVFSVSDFEKFISCPALVWLKQYLGVRATEENIDIWRTSTGKWIHDWLAAIADAPAKNFARLPRAKEMDERVRAAAEAKRAEIARYCHAASKPLPDWWESGWQNALFLSRVLAEKLAAVDDWPWIATEWNIEEPLEVHVADGATLSFRGRMDSVLAQKQLAPESLSADELWILDYKTGAKKPLAAGREDANNRRPALRKRLLDGSALQLALYSFAARQLGAKSVFVSLLSPLVRKLAPQLEGNELAAESDIFAELWRMQQTGIFGMHGPLRSAFRPIEDYPLATLAIDQDTLEQRWELTHPALVREEEDIFW